MACAGSIIQACDFPQFLVDQTPKFDELIMEDIRPTDGWLLNVSTGTTPMGTPVEITQDRFRNVYPNVTKAWRKVVANGPGCQGNPCDPPEHQIGWGADRLTYFLEGQEWQTPLLCYDQDMHITHAEQHVQQIINEILRPATTSISSVFLRKRALLWAKQKWAANQSMSAFTYQWTLGGLLSDEEIYFDCSVSPANLYLLVPQMLQNRFSPLMRRGYGGKNPFKETAPFIELVTDMDTCWSLDKLGGSVGVGGTPSVNGNWRFTEWGAANEYWRYGFSGQIGNYMVRVDEMGLRFNFVGDLGATAHSSNGNRYRYQIVLPFRNGITTGAGGSAGLGSDENPDFDNAQYSISYIWHKKAMELLVPDARPLNAEMPFGHRDFGGKWQFVMDNLGADANGVAITNKRRNKGQFIADFRYYVRPLHTEFAEAIFHKREQFCIPQVSPCNPDPGYPVQSYNSSLPICPLPTGWPANTGPIAIPQTTGTIQGVSVPIATGNTEPVDTAQPIAGETSTNPPDR
jgi:hypothetical protein